MSINYTTKLAGADAQADLPLSYKHVARRKLKPWHIHSTVGTHRRTNPSLRAHYVPVSPARRGLGIQMTGALDSDIILDSLL